ncbi:uncharacterized protein FOMMEDRAFT_159691 [Fomitiporia mediterranea MF3/22]|uniref:uncharacterized protein n=1 Tax=Fomitiporia mediterranea (strain MF3/22) TaxID=694068 RepID=UPI0004409895|nr:uncharacterized protein FOMMEDRAFT_159691 [Fomitiporia mediterranea MF3/22]EJD00079.1 hypothetical protein FOMMEDRAFT_159691 [Fomitiporia mediterranea MF3/22]
MSLAPDTPDGDVIKEVQMRSNMFNVSSMRLRSVPHPHSVTYFVYGFINTASTAAIRFHPRTVLSKTLTSPVVARAAEQISHRRYPPFTHSHAQVLTCESLSIYQSTREARENNKRQIATRTIVSVDDSGSQLSDANSEICSQHSQSDNATASDLPGPGRTVGKLFDRLGHSLEALVYKTRAKSSTCDIAREMDPVASEDELLDDGSSIVGSEESYFNSDAESDISTSYPYSDNQSDESIVLSSNNRFRRSIDTDTSPHECCPSVIGARWSSASTDCSVPSTDSFALTTCSLSRSLSTDATLSNLTGPGRVLGQAYSLLGGGIEHVVNTLLAGRSPDTIAARLHPVLRKLLHSNFMLRYNDLEKAEVKGIEGVLGVQRGTRGLDKKDSRRKKRRKNGNFTSATLKLHIEQSCVRMLEHASKFSTISFMRLHKALHEMQIRALFNILELAATYPIARECFISLGARDRIAALQQVIVDISVRANERDRWRVAHSPEVEDAVKTLSILRSRCMTVLRKDDVFDLWRAFFLSGDEYESDKIILRLLSYFSSDEEASFLVARILTSILRHPVRPERRILSETTWSEILLTLSRLLVHEHNRYAHSDLRGTHWPRIDPDALDALIHAALERVSIYLGQFSLTFASDDSPLMTVVYALRRHENSLTRYPNAANFASLLIPARNRQRMRRAIPKAVDGFKEVEGTWLNETSWVYCPPRRVDQGYSTQPSLHD